MSDPEDLTAGAALEALVARLLLREIDEDLVRTLGASGVAEGLEALAGGTLGWLREPWTPTREEQAREEFTRLFLVPGGVPPLASAWVPGERERLGETFATLVSRAMEALGREPEGSTAAGRLPIDHLGLLLDLVAHAGSASDPSLRKLEPLLRFGRLRTAYTRSLEYRATWANSKPGVAAAEKHPLT